jgi:hypothetical protein
MGEGGPAGSDNKSGVDQNLKVGALPAASAKPAEVQKTVTERGDLASGMAGELTEPADAGETSPEEQKAGKLHGVYLDKTLKIQEKDVSEVQNKLKGSSIADVRYNTALLSGVQENKDPKQRALNLKDETAKRLSAYTKDRNGDWYTLDYETMGSDSEGMSHEMNVGLGDVLLDSDITDVLIEQYGVVIKAHRGIVPSGRHAGRVGFLDENNEYVATHTGDKFKILSGDESNLEDAAGLSSYMKNVESEDAARASHKQNFDEEVKAVKEGNAYLEEADLFKGDFSEEGSVADQIGGKLSASQLANARIIEEEFKAAGLQNSIIAAAIVNAYAESGLRAEEGTGDSGNSIGLFQLHSRGAGHGLSVAERKDPRINTRTILQREVLTERGDRLRNEARNGASVQKLAIIFSQDIERPGAWDTTSGTKRASGRLAGIAKKIFGGGQAA